MTATDILNNLCKAESSLNVAMDRLRSHNECLTDEDEMAADDDAFSMIEAGLKAIEELRNPFTKTQS